MRGRGIFAPILAAAGALCVALSVPGQANDAPFVPFAGQLLQAHNAERAQAGVPPLRWSDRLAAEAHRWALHLADEGRMIHATRDERRQAGENLWMGPAGYYTAEFMVGAFIAEKQHFRNGTFPEVSTTGRWRDVGHYTQVVWRETQEVGCALVRNDSDDFLVCRYWPAGNWYGRDVF